MTRLLPIDRMSRMFSPWPIVLLSSCAASPVKQDSEVSVGSPDSGAPDSADSVPPDSVECDACALVGQGAGVGSVDTTCRGAGYEVVDPFDIEIKAELQVDPSWWEGYGYGAAPVVADIDGDGVPDIAVNECSRDGSECQFSVFAADGSVLLEAPASWGTLSPVAAIELDGVPGAELLRGYYWDSGWEHGWDLFAQRFDGEVIWRLDVGQVVPERLTVADLDADGAPEILTNGLIIDAQTGRGIGRYDQNGGGITIATVDIDHDGHLEFAEGGRLFDSDGSTLWTLPAYGGVGGVAVAMQADTDPDPEFLFINDRCVIADADGALLTEFDCDSRNPEYSAVADLDGDGSPEIVVVTGRFAVAVYRPDGTLFWERDDLGYIEQIGAWDVNGDGASELLAYEMPGMSSGSYALKILSGPKGDVVWSTPHLSAGCPPPIVADMDGDGHAEIIMQGGFEREGPSPSVTIYHQVNDTWPAAGPAWPVPDYHLTNIGPAGEVPVSEPDPAPWTYNLYNARPAVDSLPVSLTPTLVQTCSDACEDGGSVQIEVAVTNSGTVDATNVLVRVSAGGTPVTETTLLHVGSGVVSAGVVLTIPGTSFDLGEVRVIVDPDGTSPECDETDNELVVADPR